MASEILTYGDFSAGDWGRIGPEKAPKNSFQGTNVLVYRTGELGVRGGIRNVSPSGQSNGVIWGAGELPLSPGSLWYGQGTAIKYFALPGGAVSTAAGALTGSPGSVYVDENGATVYLCTANANGYSFNGTTITSLNNMPNAQAIALYGDRLAVVPISAQNTVQFSAGASFNNWTISAGNAVSVTVGDTDQITALFSQRSHLAVMKRDSSLFVLTGTPGTNEALRQVYRFNGPPNQRTAGRTRSDDRIWYAPNNSQVLAAFDGNSIDLLDNLPIVGQGSATTQRAVKTFRDDDQAGLFALVPDASGSTTNELWLRYKGVWTRHTFGVTLSNYSAVTRYGYPQDGDADVSDVRYGTAIILTDGGGASATPTFYSWQPFMDRPGLEADPFAASIERAGDASAAHVTGSFNLPHFADDRGRELQVQRVRVDFRSWNTGASDNTRLDLTVRSIREYDGTYVDSAAQTWEDAPGNSSLAGTYRRKEFSFGDQGFGSGFQLRLSNMKGVSIRRIVVTYDTRPAR